MYMKTKSIIMLILLSIFTVTSLAQELIPIRGENGKYGYKYTPDGKWIVRPKYDQAGYFHCGRAYVTKTAGWYKNRHGGKLAQKYKSGYIDRNGKVVIGLKYDLADDFINGIARVNIFVKDEKTSDRIKSRFLYGYIDINGKPITPLKYSLAENFINGMARVVFAENGHLYEAYINTSGQMCSEKRLID